MYYEFLYAISSLDRLSVELVRYGIWDSYVRYGLKVQYFRYWYSDMMSYNNSIFNISASVFSILVFSIDDITIWKNDEFW